MIIIGVFFVTIFIHSLKIIEDCIRLHLQMDIHHVYPRYMSPPPLSAYISTCTWIPTMYICSDLTYPKECIHVIIKKHQHTVYDLIVWITHFSHFVINLSFNLSMQYEKSLYKLYTRINFVTVWTLSRINFVPV